MPSARPLASDALARLIAILMLGPVCAIPGLAAETEMVGVLAVALEPEVVKQLELSKEQLAKLAEVVDRREMKGISKAMKLARLPREERVEEFADFRNESERLGLALLTAEQADQLRQLAAQRDDPALQSADASTDTPSDSAESSSAAPETDQRPSDQQQSDRPPSDRPSSATAETDKGVEDKPEKHNATSNLPSAGGDQPNPQGSSGQGSSGQAAGGEAPPSAEQSADPGKLSFNFEQQPWSEVIRWFADQAGLSVIVDAPPEGTLTYFDDRSYTPAEALDVLNGVLLTKGYTLVRKDRMLLVIDLEQDYIPPNVVTDVPLEQLDQRGQYELVRVLIELGEIDATSAADSLQRLTGPQGTIVVLPDARLLQVTETAGRIRTMLRVVEAMQSAAEPLPLDAPELRSYPLGGADGETMLAVLETLLEGTESARIALDEQTASLIALANTAEHRAIQQTLDKLQTDGRRVEMIRTETIDPLTAAALVTRMFDPLADDDKKRDPNAPIIQADPITESLLVRGTDSQISQIRKLVEDLDTPAEAVAGAAGGTVRSIPLSGIELEQALERVDAVWPSLRANPLRMTSPSGRIPSFRPGAEVEDERRVDEFNRLFDGRDLFDEPAPPREQSSDEATARPRTTSQKNAVQSDSPFRFAVQPAERSESPASESSPTELGDSPPIFISPGAGSTLIASADAEALDTLEQLLAQVANASALGSRQYAVFYLKFADAKVAASLLDSVFGGGGGSGGGSLLGDLAGAAVGGQGGDMVSDLLGFSGGSDAVGFSSVSVDIVPDVRLNALYVNATPADLQTVNELLRLIDQPRGPDRIESYGVPRLIRVENTSAEEVLAVVREVFADRLAGSGAGGGGQPSPQDFLKALAGAESGKQEQEPEKMVLGVDGRSNSIVVRSSEQLYDEVRLLVSQLDRSDVEPPKATRVVTLRNTGSAALRQTLLSMLGDKAVVTGGAAEADTRGARGGRSNSDQDRSEADTSRQQKEVQQRLENFRNMQRTFERLRSQQGGGGRGGGAGRGGGGRGGGGRGGDGGGRDR